MKKVVVEPAFVDKDKNFAAVTKEKGDEMLFPHVDSCLAVVIEHKDGNFSGVHVPQVWDSKSDFALQENLNRALKEGAIDLDKIQVDKIHCVGDGSWKQIAQAKFLSSNKFKFAFRETGPHGSDVRAVHGKSGVEVVDIALVAVKA